MSDPVLKRAIESGDQVAIQMVQAERKADALHYIFDLKDAGIVTLALLIIVVVGGWAMKRFRADGKVEDARGNFYGDMSAEMQKLRDDVQRLVRERDDYFKESAKLAARITVLEQHEVAVEKLKLLLDEKDKQLEELRSEIERRNDAVSDLEIARDMLEARVRQLERMVSGDCEHCDYKINSTMCQDSDNCPVRKILRDGRDD